MVSPYQPGPNATPPLNYNYVGPASSLPTGWPVIKSFSQPSSTYTLPSIHEMVNGEVKQALNTLFSTTVSTTSATSQGDFIDEVSSHLTKDL